MVRLFAISLVLALPVLAQAAPAPSPSVAAVVVINGKIDDFARDAFMRRFAQARAAGAATIIVEIDTNGGLVTSALDMSGFIKRQRDVHTIAFVRDKAISAGAMIALACDELVMEPGSRIGDCAPIAYRSDGSVEALPPAERAKAQSPVLADFRDSARRNRHDPLLAEAMVALDHEVHFAQSPAGEMRLVNGEEFAALNQQGWTAAPNLPDPINRGNELLTLPTDIAVAVGLARGEFISSDELARTRNLSIVARFEPNVGENLIETLANPFARLVLLIIFLISLKIALATPGHGAPEAITVISLGALLGVPLLTGYAQWWEVLMVFAGLALVAFEIFVFPGHFVSAIIGIVMIVAGLVLTFAGSEPAHRGVLPNLSGTWRGLESGLAVVTSAMVCSLLLTIWLNRFLPKIPYLNRIMLAPVGGDPTLMGALGADVVWPLVGQTGRAISDLKPGGSAAFHDETLNDQRQVSVLTDGAYVRAGSEIVVTESRGNRVVVRAASSAGTER